MRPLLLRVRAGGLLVFSLFINVNTPYAAESATPVFEAFVPCRQITPATPSHWFGYYDKFQFDPSNRYVLGQSVGFDDRIGAPTEPVELGMVDTEDHDRWIPLAKSSAWCWQQGCMLQWLPGTENKIIYNDRRDGKFISIIKDIKTGEERVMPRAVYNVAPDGRTALSNDFARLYNIRPGYAYVGANQPTTDVLHPADDGLYLVDLVHGTSRLIISLDRIANNERTPEVGEGKHWFDVPEYNPTGTRFCFLHRWQLPGGRGRVSRFYTADASGEILWMLNDLRLFSHFIWRDPTHILGFARQPEDGTGAKFHLFTDLTREAETIGDGILTQDGHCTYSLDKQWVLVDTYPDKDRYQHLRLYRPSDGKLVPVGKFYMPPAMRGEWRCDLHPRWSRDGKSVCIDSGHSGRRQMYLLDVSGIVGGGR